MGDLIRIALGRSGSSEMKSKHPKDSSDLVRAARAVTGDAEQDANLTDDERKAMEEARRKLARPNAADVKKMAHLLTGSN